MCSRRRVEIADSDFEVIREEMFKLSQNSPSDCKSFLLMTKTLFPSSVKLKLIEYQLSKESGDSNHAAEIVRQLYDLKNVFDSSQINLLDGLLNDPLDHISCEIFSNLPFSIQRDILHSHFETCSDILLRCSCILQLINRDKLTIQPPLLASLISMVHSSLLDGAKSVQTSNNRPSMHSDLSSKTQVNDSPKVTPNSQSLINKSEVSDEGEEGEVLGCDEDEDDEVDEHVVHDKTISIADVNPTSIINVYVFKIAYDLLPAIYKFRNLVKLDYTLITNSCIMSLKFLFAYVSHLPSRPTVEGLEDSLLYSYKSPESYLTECMKMVGTLLQWPSCVISRLDTEICSCAFVNMVVESIMEAKSLLDHGRSLRKKDGRKRRVTHNRTMEFGENEDKSLKAVCLFWFTFITLGSNYFRTVNRSFIDTNSTFPVLKIPCLPLDLKLIFDFGSKQRFEGDENSKPFELIRLLHELWNLRSYSSVDNYSLGTRELDMWNTKIRPISFLNSGKCYESCFERVIRLELFLFGLNCNHQEVSWSSNILLHQFTNHILTADNIQFSGPSEYNLTERAFILWISLAFSKTYRQSFGMKTEVHYNTVPKRIAFARNLRFVYSLMQNQDKKITYLSDSCCFIPLTKKNIALIAAKCLCYWLCDNSLWKESVSSVITACLVCVLAQIDTVKCECIWTSIDTSVIKFLQVKWRDARCVFIRWLTGSTCFIFDVGLLNLLVQLESGYSDHEGSWSEHDTFLNKCLFRIQSSSSVSCEFILEEFIHHELENIINCLESNK